MYLYLLSRWFLLSLILFTYSPQRPPSHYLRFQREKILSVWKFFSSDDHHSLKLNAKKCLTAWLTYRQFSWAAVLLSIIGLTSSPSVFPWLRYFSQGNGQKYPQKIFCTNINWFVIFQTTVTASAHLTVSITLERYFAVVHPLSHFHRR